MDERSCKILLSSRLEITGVGIGIAFDMELERIVFATKVQCNVDTCALF